MINEAKKYELLGRISEKKELIAACENKIADLQSAILCSLERIYNAEIWQSLSEKFINANANLKTLKNELKELEAKLNNIIKE